jgi:hypothetical protein
MGYWKEVAIRMQESDDDRHLADKLGISFEELCQTDYEIDTDESSDGLIYGYRIVFSEDSPKSILDKIERLEDGRTVRLEPWEFDQDYDYEEQFEAITDNQDFLQKFKDELENLKSLSSLTTPDSKTKDILNRQIFISVIGTMETFLSDAFINLTFDNEDYFKNFIETHPEFKKQNFELREIYKEYDKLEETAKRVMLDTIYHNLPTVSQMFADTFKIEFPSIKEVYELVLKRHDLVHRNGKTKDGNPVVTDDNAINNLMEKVTKFVDEIATILKI